jgi:hypothetical protein
MAVRSAAFSGIVSAGIQFNGSGAGLSTNTIPRPAVAYGTASHVVINAGDGSLSSEAQLTVGKGGSGASTLTGILKGNGAAAFTTVTGSTGGITYWSDANTLSTSAVGISGQILRSAGAGTPTWSTASSMITLSSGLTWAGDYSLSLTAPVSTTIGGTGSDLSSSSTTGVLKMIGTAGSRTISVSNLLNVDIDSSAAIDRTKVAAGTANHVLINNSSGVMSSEANLAVTRGGTGIGTLTGIVKGNATSAMSALTGTQWGVTYWSDANTITATAAGTSGYFLKANLNSAPTWEAISASIVAGTGLSFAGSTLNLIVPVTSTNGGTGSNMSSSNTLGFVKMTGSLGARTMTVALVGNTDIDSSAAIDRSKLALGTANYVVINDSGGNLSSEANLAVSRGGSGTGTLTGIVKGNATSAMTALTGTQWGVTYWSDANTISATAAGTSGYFLRANLNSAPTWEAVAASIVAGTGLSFTGSTLNLIVPVTSTNGGTGSNMSSSNTLGFVKMTGTAGSRTMTVALVSNTDIDSSAAIDRSKVATGTANHVIINDASGNLSSEANLAVTRGGSGVGTLTGIVKGNATSAMTALTGTQWGVTYWSDVNTITATAAGTSGYVLKANGAAAPTWVAPGSGLFTAGTGLSWSSSTLNLISPVITSTGGTGADMSSSNTVGVVKMTGVLGSRTMAVSGLVAADLDASFSLDRTKVAAGTANNVVINDAGGVLSSESQLALTRGGTNASLTSDVSLVKFLQFTAGATAVSTITASAAATPSSAVIRDSNGETKFSSINITSVNQVTTVAPSANSSISQTASVSTTVGTTAYILNISTTSGYSGTIHLVMSVSNSTLGSHYGSFQAIYRWKRAGVGLDLTTTAPSKLIDRSDALADYDIACVANGNDVRINCVHGAYVAASALFWTMKYDIVHNKLSV